MTFQVRELGRREDILRSTGAVVDREYVVEPEVAGGLADQTVLDTSRHPPIVKRLHYVFSGWMGDDIVETFPCFIVTSRLAEAIAAARLSGAEFDDVVISKDPQFVRFSMEVANNLPAWRWLRPAGEPHASDFWQQRPDGRLVVSERSLDVLRRFNLNHAEVVGVE